MARRITDEKERRIKARYPDIHKVVSKADPKMYSAEVREAVLQELFQGVDPMTVAKATGIGKTTVYKWWKLARMGNSKKRRPTTTVEPTTVVEGRAVTVSELREKVAQGSAPAPAPAPTVVIEPTPDRPQPVVMPLPHLLAQVEDNAVWAAWAHRLLSVPAGSRGPVSLRVDLADLVDGLRVQATRDTSTIRELRAYQRQAAEFEAWARRLLDMARDDGMSPEATRATIERELVGLRAKNAEMLVDTNKARVAVEASTQLLKDANATLDHRDAGLKDWYEWAREMLGHDPSTPKNATLGAQPDDLRGALEDIILEAFEERDKARKERDDYKAKLSAIKGALASLKGA